MVIIKTTLSRDVYYLSGRYGKTKSFKNFYRVVWAGVVPYVTVNSTTFIFLRAPSIMGFIEIFSDKVQ